MKDLGQVYFYWRVDWTEFADFFMVVSWNYSFSWRYRLENNFLYNFLRTIFYSILTQLFTMNQVMNCKHQTSISHLHRKCIDHSVPVYYHLLLIYHCVVKFFDYVSWWNILIELFHHAYCKNWKVQKLQTSDSCIELLRGFIGDFIH